MDPDLGNIKFSEAALDALGEKREAEELNLLDSKQDFIASDREWFNGDSFSWRLMRLAFVQLMQQQIDALVKLLNLDNECEFTSFPFYISFILYKIIVIYALIVAYDPR